MTCGWASSSAASRGCWWPWSWSCSASVWASIRSSWASASCSWSEGATSLLHTTWFGKTYPRLPAQPQFAIPFLKDIPVLGGSLFTQPLPVYVGLVLVAVIAWALRRTTAGLEIRAAGERPDSLDAAGVSVVRTRAIAEMSAGFLAGVGGAYLAIVSAGTFVPLLTNGRASSPSSSRCSDVVGRGGSWVAPCCSACRCR